MIPSKSPYSTQVIWKAFLAVSKMNFSATVGLELMVGIEEAVVQVQSEQLTGPRNWQTGWWHWLALHMWYSRIVVKSLIWLFCWLDSVESESELVWSGVHCWQMSKWAVNRIWGLLGKASPSFMWLYFEWNIACCGSPGMGAKGN